MAVRSEPDTAGREEVVVRVFAAPRKLVWDAWTRPEHVRRWYGLRVLTMTACDIDLRAGGRYRFVLRDPGGAEHAFSGEYREVVPPERLVNTWRWEGMPDAETLGTTTFAEADGQTTVTMRTLFQTPEHLAGWAGAGGREGMAETLDRLGELLATM